MNPEADSLNNQIEGKWEGKGKEVAISLRTDSFGDGQLLYHFYPLSYHLRNREQQTISHPYHFQSGKKVKGFTKHFVFKESTSVAHCDIWGWGFHLHEISTIQN